MFSIRSYCAASSLCLAPSDGRRALYADRRGTMSSAEEQDVQRLMGIANATAWMRPVAGLGATVTSFWRRPAFRCHHGGIASRSRSLQSNDGHRRRGYHGRGLWIEPREIRGTIALDQELSGLLASCTVRPNSRGVRRAGRERRSAKPHSVPDSQESVRLRVAARRGQASPAGATGHWEASETSQKGWAVPATVPNHAGYSTTRCPFAGA